MTPEDRKAAAMARTKAREDAERQERAAALKAKQAKLREQTKRDSKMPKGKR